MYAAHAFALSFKDNLLRRQVDTWASTLTCTSDQFCSTWRTGPNHTPRMRTGLSLQQKGPGRVSLPVQALIRKYLLLSKLKIAPSILSYSATAFFTAFRSRRRDTKTVISSANPETLAVRGSAKRTPRRARFAYSSRSLWSRGSKARTKRWQRKPGRTDRSRTNASRSPAPLSEGCGTS